MKKGRDSSQGGFRTGGIHERRDLGLEGFRTIGIQERRKWDTGKESLGQEGCGTGNILNERRARLMGCRTGGM